MIHPSEMTNMKPETVAFISYIANDVRRVPYQHLIYVEQVEKFAAVETRYVMRFYSSATGSVLEHWIIYVDDQPSAVAIREIKNGIVNDDSIGFIQLVMRGYDFDGVIDAIKSIPIRHKLH